MEQSGEIPDYILLLECSIRRSGKPFSCEVISKPFPIHVSCHVQDLFLPELKSRIN